MGLHLGQVDDPVGVEEGFENLGLAVEFGALDLDIHQFFLVKVDDAVGPAALGGRAHAEHVKRRPRAAHMQAEGGIVAHPDFLGFGMLLEIAHHRFDHARVDYREALGRRLKGQVRFDQDGLAGLDDVVDAADRKFDGLCDFLFDLGDVLFMADEFAADEFGISFQSLSFHNCYFGLGHDRLLQLI